MIFESKVELTKDQVIEIVLEHLKKNDNRGINYYGATFKIDEGGHHDTGYYPSKFQGMTINASFEL